MGHLIGACTLSVTGAELVLFWVFILALTLTAALQRDVKQSGRPTIPAVTLEIDAKDLQSKV